MNTFRSLTLENFTNILFLIIQAFYFYFLTYGNLYQTMGSPIGFLIVTFVYCAISEIVILIFSDEIKCNYKNCTKIQVSYLISSLLGMLLYFTIIFFSLKYQEQLITLRNDSALQKASDFSELSGWYYAVSNWVNLSFAFFLVFRVLGINLSYLICKVRNYLKK